MFKKIMIGVLMITVVGAASAAVAYRASSQGMDPILAPPEPLVANSQVEPLVQPQTYNLAESSVAAASLGEPWQADGTILELDANGFDFALESGETVYVELGPADFWQAQQVSLLPGMQATVLGSINAGIIHAMTVELSDGQVLQLRQEAGQPLWSGGTNAARGQNAGQASGTHIPNPIAQVDEWITLQGTLVSYQAGNMTISTSAGELISFQTGKPSFFAQQGVTLQVGDEVEVVGFYEGEQFSAGEITQLSTGLKVMLRDPNGRPLWAGPGSGNGNNGANAGNMGGNGYRGGNQ